MDSKKDGRLFKIVRPVNRKQLEERKKKKAMSVPKGTKEFPGWTAVQHAETVYKPSLIEIDIKPNIEVYNKISTNCANCTRKFTEEIKKYTTFYIMDDTVGTIGPSEIQILDAIFYIYGLNVDDWSQAFVSDSDLDFAAVTHNVYSEGIPFCDICKYALENVYAAHKVFKIQSNDNSAFTKAIKTRVLLRMPIKTEVNEEQEVTACIQEIENDKPDYAGDFQNLMHTEGECCEIVYAAGETDESQNFKQQDTNNFTQNTNGTCHQIEAHCEPSQARKKIALKSDSVNCSKAKSENGSKSKPVNVSRSNSANGSKSIGSKSKSIVGSKSKSLIGSKSKSLIGSKPKSLNGSKSKSLIGSKSKSIIDLKSKSIIDLKSKSIIDLKSKSIIDSKSKSIIDSKSKSIIGSKANSVIGSKSKSIIGSKSKSVIGSISKPIIGSQFNSLIDPESNSVVGCKLNNGSNSKSENSPTSNLEESSTPNSENCSISKETFSSKIQKMFNEKFKPHNDSQSNTENSSKSKPEDDSKSKSEDDSKSNSENNSKSKPEDKSKSKPEDKSKSKPEDKSKSKPEDKSKSKPEDKSKSKPGDDSEDDSFKPENVSKSKSENVSKSKSENVSKSKSENVSKSKSENVSKSKSEKSKFSIGSISKAGSGLKPKSENGSKSKSEIGSKSKSGKGLKPKSKNGWKSKSENGSGSEEIFRSKIKQMFDSKSIGILSVASTGAAHIKSKKTSKKQISDKLSKHKKQRKLLLSFTKPKRVSERIEEPLVCRSTLPLPDSEDANFDEPDGPFLILCCNETFDSPYTFDDHRKELHPDTGNGESTTQQAKCNICGLPVQVDQVSFHMRSIEHLGSNYFKSDDPSPKAKSFKQPEDPSKAVLCKLCNIFFPRLRNLNGHYRRVHPELFKFKFYCDKCNKGFGSEYFLNNHIKAGNLCGLPKRRFVCAKCGKNYETANRLKVHMDVHEDEESEDKELFKCPKCGKMLKHRYSLQKHLQREHPENQKLFVCEQCGKTTKNMTNMRIHMETHGVARKKAASAQNPK